jgi:hypothetical protein
VDAQTRGFFLYGRSKVLGYSILDFRFGISDLKKAHLESCLSPHSSSTPERRLLHRVTFFDFLDGDEYDLIKIEAQKTIRKNSVPVSLCKTIK